MSTTYRARTLKIAHHIANDAITCFIGNVELQPLRVNHFKINTRYHDTKFAILWDLFDDDMIQCVIFCSAPSSADQVYDRMKHKSSTAHLCIIHEDMDMYDCITELRNYRMGNCRIMITTDMLRGIDMHHVNL